MSRRDIQIRETCQKTPELSPRPPSSLPWARLPPLCFPELWNLAGGCPPPPGATFSAPLHLGPETSPERNFNKPCLTPLRVVLCLFRRKTLHLVPKPGKEIEPPPQWGDSLLSLAGPDLPFRTPLLKPWTFPKLRNVWAPFRSVLITILKNSNI
uniref:Uncharacterized protein n=1 Tax=Mustela putorius furo TaxID=9669 RepID=M3Z0I1_MUSPF